MEQQLSNLHITSSFPELENATVAIASIGHASRAAQKAAEVFTSSFGMNDAGKVDLPLKLSESASNRVTNVDFRVWTMPGFCVITPSTSTNEIVQKDAEKAEKVSAVLAKWISAQKCGKIVILAGDSAEKGHGISFAASGSWKSLQIPHSSVQCPKEALYTLLGHADTLLLQAHIKDPNGDVRMEAMQLSEAAFKEIVNAGASLPDILEPPPIWIEDDKLDPELQRELYQ